MSSLRDALLTEPRVFGVFGTFKLQPQWQALERPQRRQAAADVVALVQRCEERLAVDAYLTRGLKADCDYLLRVHGRDLTQVQDFLAAWQASVLGGHSILVHTLVGVTKPLSYITPDKSATLSKALTSAVYEGPPPQYAIVIPVKKTAAWWNLSPEKRHAEIEVHTEKARPFLSTIKRKLYHSTGLDDLDFITYFETRDLGAFHELMLSLATIPENTFHARWGDPTILATIHTLEEVLDVIVG